MLPKGPAFPTMRVLWGMSKLGTSGSTVAIPESIEPDVCLRVGCAEIFRVHPASATSPQGVSGFRFLCCCQRLEKRTEREEERWEEICLHT